MSDALGHGLRRGWTTGACAAAGAKAAYTALLTGEFPDPVSIRLPRGHEPAFALARHVRGDDWAEAGIVKDAGDDPDVTHGALVLARVRRGAPGAGVTFRAGDGVGIVTKPGLRVPVGEPAINPMPRRIIAEALAEVAATHGIAADVEVEIAIPEGEALAKRTMNGRLGIVGGLSILGTSGVVIPYSCSAWIHSIYGGVDVARAAGRRHIAAATGSTSEGAVQRFYGLPEEALIDMGDFVGALLKYLKKHPLPRLTIAGGFGKIAKLAMGYLDLHSGRSSVDIGWLADRLREAGADSAAVEAARACETANAVLERARISGLPLADIVARFARDTALRLTSPETSVEVLIFDREGTLVGRADG